MNVTVSEFEMRAIHVEKMLYLFRALFGFVLFSFFKHWLMVCF